MAPAPSFYALLERKQREDPDSLARVHGSFLMIDDAEYLHWDDLRYKAPPAGLDHEEWWLALKLRRLTQLRAIPLNDLERNAFTYTLPDSLLEALAALDRE